MPTAACRSRRQAPANISARRRWGEVRTAAVSARSMADQTVIPGWCVSTGPPMRNCASGNLELPGSRSLSSGSPQARPGGARNNRPWSRIIRPVRATKYMDGLAGRESRPRERHVHVKYEVKDRQRADRVKSPCRYTFHQDGLERRTAKGQSRDTSRPTVTLVTAKFVLEHDPEKHALGLRPDGWIPVFRRDKRGTRLRGDHAQTIIRAR
jgi:hypothetical protein